MRIFKSIVIFRNSYCLISSFCFTVEKEKEQEARLNAESPTRVTSPGGTPVSRFNLSSQPKKSDFRFKKDF